MLYPNELRAHIKLFLPSAPGRATRVLDCSSIQSDLLPSAKEADALSKLVGVERFELPTSCSQSRRATRLRYTPLI